MKALKRTSMALGFMAMVAMLALVMALAGCSASGDSSASSSSQASSSASSSASSQSWTATAVEGIEGKTLVAYFSGSGNTERVAQDIATALDAALFALEPVTPYTEADLNWRDEGSRVSAEHNDEALRTIALTQVTPDDFASYDNVFIGYPIWWGVAAWPVNTFVSDNDFSGKNVIPFCTSASSGLGESAELLEQLASTGTWLEGHRFASSATDAEVEEWLATL